MRIFITGASTGLGRALALELAGPEAVMGLSARREDLLEELARELEARGAKARTFPADVRDTDAMAQAAEDFLAWAGGVDRVIANAGIAEGRKREDATRVALVIATNLIGVTNTVLPFVAAMRAQGHGQLVAISSVAGHRALPGSAAYSSSKAGVITFMDALRMTLHGSGVHAMTICPGFVRTPLTDANDHAMPFLMDAAPAARLMIRAMARRDATYTFPWQMRGLSTVLRLAPEWFVRRVVGGVKPVKTPD